ncbi:MAG: tetratricopeptide repeat protein, partial [Chloroflexi bacterium]|nr:tetratricopeptide repeat protein [Chloroflexota bacterium]
MPVCARPTGLGRRVRAQQQALTIWRQRSAPGPVALALNNIGWDLHMLGQYEAAIATYREALDWARRAASNRTEVMVLAGQADVYADIGNREAAAEVYRQALSKAEQVGDWALLTYLCRGMARLDRWAGNFAGALEWLRRAALAAGEGKGESALANLESLRGILLVEMGHRAEGRRTLGKVCAEFEKSGALVDFSQALFFRACAEFRDGEPDEAARSLAQAFAAAEQVGYDQMLVSEALLALDVLEALSPRSDVGPRATALVSRARAAGNAWAQAQRTADQSVQAIPDHQVVLKVAALGVARVLKHGVEISKTEWTSQRIREMFFYLVDRAPVQRDRVLDAFWPDKPPGRAVNNLYQTLFRLRRTVGESVIVLEEQVCRLPPTAGVEYDVA